MLHSKLVVIVGDQRRLVHDQEALAEADHMSRRRMSGSDEKSLPSQLRCRIPLGGMVPQLEEQIRELGRNERGL